MNLSLCDEPASSAVDVRRPFGGTVMGGQKIALDNYWQEMVQTTYDNLLARNWMLENEFRILVHQWKRETRLMSFVQDIIDNPSYQMIIRMGVHVLPLLLREMEDRPDHWHFALKAIANTDPVAKGNRGDLTKVREAWLSWGHQHGLSW